MAMSVAPDLDSTLEQAVSEAIAASPTPVNYTTIAQAICQTQNGNSLGKCYCDRKQWRKCHAALLYGDMAAGVLALLKRGGKL